MVFTEHPILGVGSGGYHYALKDYLDATLANPVSYYYADNVFVTVGVELGVVGLALLVGGLTVTISTLWRQRAPGWYAWSSMLVIWVIVSSMNNWTGAPITWSLVAAAASQGALAKGGSVIAVDLGRGLMTFRKGVFEFSAYSRRAGELLRQLFVGK
jgi:O-antigen ligase